jgi:hypothetical protein
MKDGLIQALQIRLADRNSVAAAQFDPDGIRGMPPVRALAAAGLTVIKGKFGRQRLQSCGLQPALNDVHGSNVLHVRPDSARLTDCNGVAGDDVCCRARVGIPLVA